jgi:hypothetical protein
MKISGGSRRKIRVILTQVAQEDVGIEKRGYCHLAPHALNNILSDGLLGSSPFFFWGEHRPLAF